MIKTIEWVVCDAYDYENEAFVPCSLPACEWDDEGECDCECHSMDCYEVVEGGTQFGRHAIDLDKPKLFVLSRDIATPLPLSPCLADCGSFAVLDSRWGEWEFYSDEVLRGCEVVPAREVKHEFEPTRFAPVE